MTPILLPLSALQERRACALDERIADFTAHHHREPGEDTPLREWLEVTPDFDDWLWALKCLGRKGRILGLELGLRALRRVMLVEAEYLGQAAAVTTRQALDSLWRGEEPGRDIQLVALSVVDAVWEALGQDPWPLGPVRDYFREIAHAGIMLVSGAAGIVEEASSILSQMTTINLQDFVAPSEILYVARCAAASADQAFNMLAQLEGQ